MGTLVKARFITCKLVINTVGLIFLTPLAPRSPIRRAPQLDFVDQSYLHQRC